MEQTIQCLKSPIQSKIILPGSKSVSERALIMASLADGVSEITALQIDDEIKSLINALCQLGIVIQLDEKNRSAIIAGCNGKFPKKQASIWCENQILMHFLLTTSASTPGVYFFDGPQTVKEKNLQPLLGLLCRQGAQVIPSDKQNLPITLVGADSLEGGDLLLDSSTSHTLISSLLLISPYARSAFNFTLVDLKSEAFVDMTCAMMAEFGVLVHRIHQGQFMVPVPQRYQAQDYKVETDFSIASYFFGAAAISNGQINIQATRLAQAKQTQVKILSLLQKMGCKIHDNPQGLTVIGPKSLQGIEVKLKTFSHTFVILSVLAPFARTPTHLSHLGRLDSEEEKRFKSLRDILTQMDIKIKYGSDWLTIFPSVPKGALIETDDYLIAMAASIIGLKVPNVVINRKEIVDKIYPTFFAHWNQLTTPVDMALL